MVGISYLQETYMGWDPISAGNLDRVESHTYRKQDFGSHICRKPRWGGGSHICRKPRFGDPISVANLDVGIPYLQETSMGGDPISARNLDGGWIPYLQET